MIIKGFNRNFSSVKANFQFHLWAAYNQLAPNSDLTEEMSFFPNHLLLLAIDWSRPFFVLQVQLIIVIDFSLESGFYDPVSLQNCNQLSHMIPDRI